jgi:hypothetical protein
LKTAIGASQTGGRSFGGATLVRVMASSSDLQYRNRRCFDFFCVTYLFENSTIGGWYEPFNFWRHHSSADRQPGFVDSTFLLAGDTGSYPFAGLNRLKKPTLNLSTKAPTQKDDGQKQAMNFLPIALTLISEGCHSYFLLVYSSSNSPKG